MPRVNQLSGVGTKTPFTLAHNIPIPANTITRPETAKFIKGTEAGPPSAPLLSFGRGVDVGVVDGTGVLVVEGAGVEVELTLVGLYAD
jgi:hypothetical protein